MEDFNQGIERFDANYPALWSNFSLGASLHSRVQTEGFRFGVLSHWH